MENSKFTMEYVAPTLLSPKYRYAIVRGTSCTESDALTDYCDGNNQPGSA